MTRERESVESCSSAMQMTSAGRIYYVWPLKGKNAALRKVPHHLPPFLTWKGIVLPGPTNCHPRAAAAA